MRKAESRLVGSSWIAAVLALFAVLAPPASAASGDLDTSFGVDGKVSNYVGGNINGARAVAIDGDGKIVAAGVATDDYGGLGYYQDFALVRYNEDGSLDETFGLGDGMVRTEFPESNSAANGLAIQSDGRIVAAGHASQVFALVRYQSDGTLDASFGGDGLVTTDFPDALGQEGARGVVLQEDGRIVAVGTVGEVGSKIGVVRYNTNGTLDTTFGGDGMVTTSFPGTKAASGAAIAIQTDGRIVAVGQVTLEGDGTRFGVVRYNPDGSGDATFGDDGRVITVFGRADDDVSAVSLQVDGKILAAGTSGGYGQEARFALSRYEPDGTLDASFGGDGKVTSRVTSHGAAATGISLQLNGRIVAAGYSFGDRPKFALSRYKPDGTLDTNFGGDGTVITNFSSRIDVASAIAIQADGKIVAVGTTWGWFGYFDYGEFALARYLAA